MPRRGGGRGRAGFVPSLPPKPSNFMKAHDELAAAVKVLLGPVAHVGYGYTLDPIPAGEDPFKYKQPMAEEAPKRPGAWTLYVWSNEDAAALTKIPKRVMGIPVVLRSIPRASAL